VSSRPSIPRGELLTRQALLRDVARERGWPGVAVLGRGGGTYDRHGDLMYLSGHYQSFVHLPDRPPLWSGRSHALLVIPLEGPTRLLCSAPEFDPDIAVDDAVATGEFARDAAIILDELGGGGFSGWDVAPFTLARKLPLTKFEPAEPSIEALRRRKSPAEQALLRHNGAVGTQAVEAIMGAAVPGATEGDAVAAGLAVVARHGGAVAAMTLSAGDRIESFTGRPFPGYRAERELVRGELARLDLAFVIEGYYCDFGRSWVVGGSGENLPAERLIAAVRGGLEAAVNAARVGASAGAVARAGTAALPDWAETGYPPHWGHGLGMGWEGPMLLPENDEPLEEGFALAIEVVVRAAGLAAGGEYNVLVTVDAPEILTPAAWP
jgi:Xaa-Pro aminopeptidase